MIRLSLTGMLLSVACISIAVAGDAIGFAYVNGVYRVNGAGVRGNATLFNGARVETADAPAQLQLNRGARVWLAPGSRSEVSSNGLVLLAGTGQLQGASGYALEARAIRVFASQPDSVIRVRLDETGAAVVMPVKGSAEVLNKRGIRVGNVAAGSAIRFTEQTGAGDAVRVSGCIYRDGDGFALTDRITNVKLQLRGQGIDREVGRAVDVAGTEDRGAPGRAMVVNVSELRPSGGDCAPGGGRTLLASARPLPQEPGAQVAPELSIVIIEGDGAINNIRQRTAREPIVQVEDRNRKPVAGALVTFALPKSGASGTFANGATTLSVTTDAQGRAVARGLKPNETAGQYQIAVSASYGTATATAVITQTNAIVAAAAAGGAGAAAAGLSTGAKVAIIGGVAAGGTVGGLAAAGVIGGGDSTQSSASR